MLRSLKIYVIYNAISAVIGLVFLIYLEARGSFNFSSILEVCVVMSNGLYIYIYNYLSGLLLIVILLGYGLVAIPKSFMRVKDDYVRVNKLYHSINIANDRIRNLTIDLEDLT